MSTSPDSSAAGAGSGVAVVTDSTTYLPAELTQRWGIEQVSLYVGWGGERLPEPEYELETSTSACASPTSCPRPPSPRSGTSSLSTSR